jgi:YegS/Rv2252/BmrU family lipid kinase
LILYTAIIFQHRTEFTMLPRACLIFNPVSGQGDAERDRTLLTDQLTPHFDLTVYDTTPDVSARDLAQQAKTEDYRTIIASGGDGTVSQVAGELINTKIPLGIVPRGTANAFAAAFDIPNDPVAACEVICAGFTKAVDVGSREGQPIVLLAGVGFEADVVEGANRATKDQFGALAYWFSGVQQLRTLDPFEVELETDERVITVTAIAVTVANVAPSTSIFAQGPAELVADDGLLDVTIIAPLNWTGAIAASQHLLQTAIQNRPAERDDIGYFRTRRITITTDPPQNVVIDGELSGTTPITIDCIPNGLTLILPTEKAPAQAENLSGLPDLTITPKTDEPTDEHDSRSD